MKITTAQIERVNIDFAKYAKESVKTEAVNDTIYCYGSELAMLRISQYYIGSMDKGTARVNYSQNLKTWFFALDIVS